MVMNTDFGRILKGVSCFKVIPQYFPAKLKKHSNTSVSATSLPTNLNRIPRNISYAIVFFSVIANIRINTITIKYPIWLWLYLFLYLLWRKRTQWKIPKKQMECKNTDYISYALQLNLLLQILIFIVHLINKTLCNVQNKCLSFCLWILPYM
jgi:hypothetical protein